ncbi:type VI-B CRISPR-associated RNA-guided ribonuclease Cas13b [Flavobacterium branchiophilum]|uniref:Uncharacterized protein n=1 Tax=Flavobacterium branchiophilum TaxID=55197 RepID=A0A2H3KMU7_9FLAO|nr:type VI-B CRISPR-associated RNA-guided ribonuclease Cas13b [Flavobacterium branchiophilum]PDS24838.1 hypothetical protein B0A77_06850 [Flavobacterium branchiophilum]
METKNKIDNEKTLQNNPEYFGSYLNMARHNIFLLINHLTKTFKYLPFELLKDDEDISKVEKNILLNVFDISKKEYEDERQKVYNYLIKRHHLPIIKYLGKIEGNDLVDFDKIHQFITIAFQEVNNYRNDYTHFLAIDDNNNVSPRKLDIDEKIKTDTKLLFENAPSVSYLRNFETQKEDDYKHILSNYSLFSNENVFTEHGLYFFINLFLERKYAIKLLKKIRGFKNETTPSFRATLQVFTSYCIKLPDTRLGNEFPKQTILMEMLSELNKCPKELFNHLTVGDKEKFEPKMNEEQKINILLNSVNYEDIDDEDLDTIVKDIISLKRYEDRFPNFALRFLEETNAFEQIRFQITLGKLVIKRYDKTINGIEQDRRVIKTINAFGKLSDFIGKEDEILKLIKQGIEDENIVFEQYSPHYNMNNNKIGFKIFDEESEKLQLPFVFKNKREESEFQNNPSGFISIHDLHKIVLSDLLTNNNHLAEKKIIEFVNDSNSKIFDISILNEIKEKVHYVPESFTKRNFDKKKMQERGDKKVHFVSEQKEKALLKKHKLSREQLLAMSKDDFKNKTKNKKELETFSQIKYHNYLEQRRVELQKHLPSSILVNQLPERLIDYLMNITEVDSEKRIHLKIRDIKDEAKLLLKESKSEPEEGQIIKLGEYATFIARDILNMIIDKDVKQKITQPYYNKIQNKISFFSINKEELIAIFNELQIFDTIKGHVFLKINHISNSKGLKEFYTTYLEAKKSWIKEKLLKGGKTGGYRLNNYGVKLPYSFTIIKIQCEEFNFNKWLANKNLLPVNIPNSLLDNFVNNELKKKLTLGKTDFNQTDTLSVLLRKMIIKDTQPYYDYDREYNLNKKSILVKGVNGLTSKEIKSKYDKNVEANEKIIRFYQTRDRILKLMCDFLISEDKTIGLQNEFLLKNIYPNSEISILDNTASFKQQLRKEVEVGDLYFTVVAEDTEKQIANINAWKKLEANQRKKWTDLKTKEEQELFLQNCNEDEKLIYHGQKGYQWTFKDYGRFKRFVKDKRLVDLSKYFETTIIPFDLLEYQIMEYDRIREKVFELVFKLEKAIFEKDSEGLITIELNKRPKDFNQVQFDVYLSWLQQKNISFSKNIVKWSRNKFSHTEFPNFDSIPRITNEQIEDFNYYKNVFGGKDHINISIAQKIIVEFESEINNIIAQINR